MTLTCLVVISTMKNFEQAVTIVAYTLIIRLQLFLFTPTQGLSRSGNIVIGHLFGAGRYENVKKQLNQSIAVSLILNLIMALVLIFFSNDIIGFYTTQYVVLEEVRNILFLVIWELIVFSVIYNANQALVAIGRSSFSLYSVFVKFAFLIIFILILCYALQFGRNGSFLSLVMADSVQAFFAYGVFRWLIYKKENE